ncbi:mCG146143, partial [Mus musculus]
GSALHTQTEDTGLRGPGALHSPVHHEWLTGSLSYRKWLSTVSFLASLGSPVMNKAEDGRQPRTASLETENRY